LQSARPEAIQDFFERGEVTAFGKIADVVEPGQRHEAFLYAPGRFLPSSWQPSGKKATVPEHHEGESWPS
jgi:hypothetical protein